MKLLRQEWQKVFQNKMLLLSVIVMMFIPIIYTGVILNSYWNPYDRTDNLAIAVVNQDEPTRFEEKTLRIGEELVDRLKNSNDADWHFVNAENAKKGFARGDYYMVITIPPNFSENASTAFSDTPEQMNLLYEVNPGRNFFSETLGREAINDINIEVSSNVTKEYVKTIFAHFEEAGTDLDLAADGASQIEKASDQLQTGNEQITANLNELSASTSEFEDGTSEVDSGISEVTDGAEELNTGAAQLNGSLNSLAAGSADLQSGLEEMNRQLPSESEISQLTQGLAEVQSAVNRLQAIAAESDLAPEMLQQVNELASSVNSTQQGAIDALGGYSVIRTALEGEGGLIQGSSQLTSGLYQAADGSAALAEGTGELTEQLPALEAGVSQLADGASDIHNGSAALADASGQLGERIESLNDGTSALSSQLNEGINTINSTAMIDGNYDMIANPLTVTEEETNTVPNYGHALAPNFLSLGLYIGVLAFNLVFPIHAAIHGPATGRVRWFSKFSLGFAFAVAGALILDIIMIFGMGLVVENAWKFIVISVLASLTYMFIVMLLGVALGDLGRFLSMIFLVLQVVASGGMFPVELQGTFYQAVNPYLPMTYVIYGFREAMTSALGDGIFITSVSILISWIIICNLLLYLVVRRRKENTPFLLIRT
ncbi:YhgE/Pip family protein [Planococcus lenghuensis]|uniref:ABC-2 type transporter transmembrane domain-containing protein n=1 Tax=Planococcus lenghuensis TaxID=2213202 RepID=A0A1Q2L214_9BACL|nr:YhgE/Pip domain-containing protein [Planococcus lenghuensis]AQQ54500.1 hypothetical protein B0X71_16250 [Planococcus lenghuensis]